MGFVFTREVTATFVAMTMAACMSPSARAGDMAPFTEEAAQRGLVFTPFKGNAPTGRGLGFMDLDGDNDPDLVATGAETGEIGVFENIGGDFVDRTLDANFPNSPLAVTVTGADYDGDGDIDVFIGVYNAPDLLLRNDGDWSFTNVAAQAGLDDDGPATGAVWADYDEDGWLDLYLSRDPAWNLMYHNNGDGSFSEVAVALGVECPSPQSPTFQPSFSDVDRDGDLDLFVASDRGPNTDCQNHNWLFLNNGDGSFTDVSTPTEPGWCVWGMGVATGDFNNDLYPDFYITNLQFGHPLMINQGDGTLVDMSEAYGTMGYQVGWGASFLDFDNDGWQDLYVCHVFTLGNLGVNMLFRHGGTFPAEDVAPELNVDTVGNSFCMAVADVDDDGDLDIAVQSFPDPLKLYINHEGAAYNSARFRMIGENADLHAIGANMELFADDLTMFREVYAGANHKCQNELPLHFGMGAATIAQSATASWPSGDTRQLSNIPAGETWEIYPTARLGDVNADGVWDQTDLDAFDSCYGQTGGPVVTGCEIFDFDGNWVLDQADQDQMNALVGVGCFADCNGDGMLNVLDFVCYQTQFGAGDLAADCNGDGSLNVLDFVCYQAAFAAGCP